MVRSSLQAASTSHALEAASNDSTGGSKKRTRGSYARSACIACQKRKTRCDGLQPCNFCSSRGAFCQYTSKRRSSPSVPTSTPTHQVLHDEISRLKCEVRMLNAQLEHQQLSASPADKKADKTAEPLIGPSSCLSSEDIVASALTVKAPSQASHIYGLTSPDFALNVAQASIRRGNGIARDDHWNTTAKDLKNVTYDDEDVQRQDFRRRELLRFRSGVAKDEALRLIRLFEIVVEDLYPVANVRCLRDAVENVYRLSDSDLGQTRTITEETLIVLNLVIAIAQRADSIGTANKENFAIWAVIRDIVHSKVLSSAGSITHASIAVLMCIFYFFHDRTWLAWRMCGLAGIILKEHGPTASDGNPLERRSNEQQMAFLNLSAFVVVLDRQLSIATGLPPNFHNDSLEDTLRCSALQPSTPYLRAMMAFLAITDRFHKPASPADSDVIYDNHDALELTVFQVEQWRKKALRDFLVEGGSMSSSICRTSSCPPWVHLLDLRSHVVQAVMMRPFFFPKAEAASSEKQFQPGLDLVTNMINGLVDLDSNTDTFRLQHPHLQHILTSASALLFLMVAYWERNRSGLVEHIPNDVFATVQQNHRKALGLAGAYRDTSLSAHRLWRRLVELQVPLHKLGFFNAVCSGQEGTDSLDPPSQSTMNTTDSSTNAQQQHQQQHQQSLTTFPNNGDNDMLTDLSNLESTVLNDLDAAAGMNFYPEIESDPVMSSDWLWQGTEELFQWGDNSGLTTDGYVEPLFPNLQP